MLQGVNARRYENMCGQEIWHKYFMLQAHTKLTPGCSAPRSARRRSPCSTCTGQWSNRRYPCQSSPSPQHLRHRAWGQGRKGTRAGHSQHHGNHRRTCSRSWSWHRRHWCRRHQEQRALCPPLRRPQSKTVTGTRHGQSNQRGMWCAGMHRQCIPLRMCTCHWSSHKLPCQSTLPADAQCLRCWTRIERRHCRSPAEGKEALRQPSHMLKRKQ